MELPSAVTLSMQISQTRFISIHSPIDFDQAGISNLLLTHAKAKNNRDACGTRRFAMGRAEATVCCPNPSQPDSNITLNIFDVPNYTGSSIESIPTLRLTDGVLLRVDVVIGLRQETEDLTRFATREQTQIVLLLDNLAGALVEHHLDLDVISQRMFDIVEAINSIISVHSQGVTSTLNPAKGNVIFGSVAQGWAASIRHFSKLWAAKWTGIPEDSLCRSLWGQSYFDHEKKDFTKSSQNARGAALPLSFSKFVLEPISKILRSAPTTSSQVQEVFSMAQKVGVSVPFEWTHYSSDDLIREIISNWLPVAVTIVSTIVDHVPSPQRAQMILTDERYTGPLNDEAGTSMRYCDPNGPVVVVVEKLTCGSERTDFFCVGRVLSGTLTSSQLINVIGPDYQQGRKEDYYVGKHITGLFKLDGTVLTEVESCTAGTLAIVSGVAKYMMCFGTLMSLPNPFPLSRTRITKSLPTKVVVGVKDPVNLPCFYEGIKLLCKGDPVAQVCIEETGEYVLHACSPRHADLLISELLKYFTNLQSGLLISGQRTAFCETVSAVSSLTVCAKSPNKHSRMWMTAEPMDAPLLDAIYSGKLKMNKLRELDTSSNSVIVSEIGWTRLDAAKIWCFSETEDCMICNRTKGAQYLHELKDYILGAFSWATKEGALCDEPMRRIQFNLDDIIYSFDAIHRGGGQIIPMARRALFGAQLSAQPRLMEPMFSVEIVAPSQVISGVLPLIHARRGQVKTEVADSRIPIVELKALVPAIELKVFEEALRTTTSQILYCTSRFDGHQVIPEDPYNELSNAHAIVTEIRQRKGLKPEIPSLSQFHDRL